jgi:hypothetical protein
MLREGRDGTGRSRRLSGVHRSDPQSAMTAYAEFRLRIERGTRKRNYRVIATGPGGDATGEFKLPFSDNDLKIFVLEVGRTRRGVRRIDSPEMDQAKAFGAKLFEALFKERIGELYRTSAVTARNSGQGLRIALSLAGVPELLRVPWEYLYDRPRFPSTSTHTPIVRYLDLPRPRSPLKVSLPIRILAVVSTPTDAEQIDVQQEKAKFEHALADLIESKKVAIDWLEDATLEGLRRQVGRETYHVFHYIGHGGYDQKAGGGTLLFQDEFGRGRPVTGFQLATILNDEESICLAVLNSCEGARTSLDDPFAGVATSLIESDVPAVIGMQFEITDRAAILFAGAFYSALAQGMPIDAAVGEARKAIFADHNDVEWGTPVLFMQVLDGQLFDLRQTDIAPQLDDEERLDAERRKADELLALEQAAKRDQDAKRDEEAKRDAERRQQLEADRIARDRRRQEEESEKRKRQQRLEEERLAELAAIRRRRRRRLAIAGGGVAVLVAITAFLVLRNPSASIAVALSADGIPGSYEVTGTGFQPGETVEIDVNSTGVVTAVATADGSMRKSISVTGGGSLVITALGRTSGRSATYRGEPIAASGSPPATGTLEPSLTAGPSQTSSASVPPERLAVPGILFSSKGYGKDDNEIYLIDPRTKAMTRITDNRLEETYPAWSPDRTQIAFARGSIGEREILVMDPDGSDRQSLTSGADDWFPAWSPDGRQIAFVREGRDSSSIWLVPSHGGPAEVVPKLPSSRPFRSPAWSPDGTTIAFWEDVDEPGNDDIFVIRPDGSGFRRLTTDVGVDRNPAWSPDGKTIAFVTDRDGDRPGSDRDKSDNEIYLMDAETGKVFRRLTRNDVQDGNPVWSPNGKQIAFYRAVRNDFHIMVINVDGKGELDLMTGRGGQNLDPNWG